MTEITNGGDIMKILYAENNVQQCGVDLIGILDITVVIVPLHANRMIDAYLDIAKHQILV